MQRRDRPEVPQQMVSHYLGQRFLILEELWPGHPLRDMRIVGDTTTGQVTAPLEEDQ